MNDVALSPWEMELEKAKRMLLAAELLRSNGFFEDAVSRSYYAVFHAACAALAKIGRSARTHDGIRSAFGEHFIRTGALPQHLARVLSRTAADRNDADYNSSTVFSEKDARESQNGAQDFVDAVAHYLENADKSA